MDSKDGNDAPTEDLQVHGPCGGVPSWVNDQCLGCQAVGSVVEVEPCPESGDKASWMNINHHEHEPLKRRAETGIMDKHYPGETKPEAGSAVAEQAPSRYRKR